MNSEAKIPPGSVLSKIVVDTDKWMRGHYHCRKCGREMACWQGLPCKRDDVMLGVRRLGGCLDCNQLLVEYENGTPKWIEVSL